MVASSSELTQLTIPEAEESEGIEVPVGMRNRRQIRRLLELWTICVTRRMKKMRMMAKLDQGDRTGMSPGRCTLHARTFPHYDRYRWEYALAL